MQSKEEILGHCRNLKIANDHQTTRVTQNLIASCRKNRVKRALVISLIVKEAVKLGVKYLPVVLSTSDVAYMGFRDVMAEREIVMMKVMFK